MKVTRSSRGAGWIRCCLCGRLHNDPYPHLLVDSDGQMWDECADGCKESQ